RPGGPRFCTRLYRRGGVRCLALAQPGTDGCARADARRRRDRQRVGAAMRRLIAASIVVAAACGYDVGYSGTAYRCVEHPECPDGFICVCGECRVADNYATEVIADRPIAWWRLGESSGLLAADARCSQDAYYEGGPALAEPGLLAHSSDTAVRFDGM